MSERDRRRFPRVELDVVAKALEPDGTASDVRVTNVSRVGVQIRCDQAVAARFARLSARNGPAQALDVSFSLPFSDRAALPLRLSCQPVYARLDPDGDFRVGCEIVACEGESYEYLEGYIVQCMQPA